MADNVIRELRRRRIMRARFRQSAYADDERLRCLHRRWDLVSDYMYTGDWLWIRELIKPAYEDPARLAEDAQGAPSSVISTSWPEITVNKAWEEHVHPWRWRRLLRRTPRVPRPPRFMKQLFPVREEQTVDVY